VCASYAPAYGDSNDVGDTAPGNVSSTRGFGAKHGGAPQSGFGLGHPTRLRRRVGEQDKASARTSRCAPLEVRRRGLGLRAPDVDEVELGVHAGVAGGVSAGVPATDGPLLGLAGRRRPIEVVWRRP
jgi:hypothetical protein